MFEMDEATLTSMGAQITTKEIMQQPDLWEGTLKIYEDNLPAIEEFLAKARALGGARRTRVIFCRNLGVRERHARTVPAPRW